MSQKTDLQSNNIDLQAILSTINALPEAGSGDVSYSTVYIGSSAPTSDTGTDGDIYIVRS